MSEILKFQKRLSRKTKEVEMAKGFMVKDLREPFAMIYSEYIKNYAGLCGLAANSVYMLLCGMANKEQICWPPVEYIARGLAITKPTVRKALRILESYGIIGVDRAERQANIYTITLPKQWRKTRKQETGSRKGSAMVPMACAMCENIGDGNGGPGCAECMGGSKMVVRG